MGGIAEVNSANQIGQLEALRFKTKSEIPFTQFKKRENFGKRNAGSAGGNSKGRNIQ